jgi:hypothetical protein
MSTLQENLIETIEKDHTEILELNDNKQIRKQSSMLLVRIKSAKKILSDNVELLNRLDLIEMKISKR